MKKASCPDISIVIPCYNGSNYLERCIRSLQSQQQVELEIILVDDCSVDDSYAMAQRLLGGNSQCGVYRHQRQGGVSKARNTGLEHCHGIFVMFVDADDWLYPDACVRLLEEQQKSGADLVLGNFDYVDGRGKVCPAFPARRRMKSGYYRDVFEVDAFYRCQGMFDSSCGRLFRLDTIRRFDLSFPENLGFGEDTCFVLSYLFISSQVCLLGGASCYAYFQHDSSCVHKLDVRKRLRQLLGVFSYGRELCESRGLPERILLHKAKELFYTVKRFGGGFKERHVLLEWLHAEGVDVLRQVLMVILRYGKLKHRLLARIVQRGHLRIASWLLSQW